MARVILLILAKFLTSSSAWVLRPVANVSTRGNAGFESFTIGSTTYLAAANSGDPSSGNPDADSTVWSVAIDGESLRLSKVQEMRTQGAHGWDYFEAAVAGGSAEGFLVVPNYHGCQREHGPATGDCRSTVVFRWDQALQRFEEAQRILTAGPRQTDHLVLPDGRAFVIVSESLNDEVGIYQLKAGVEQAYAVEKVQALPVAGAASVALANISGHMHLIASSYPPDHHSDAFKETRVYKLQEPSGGSQGGFEGFVETQVLRTQGCRDAELGTVGRLVIAYLSEDSNADKTATTSQVCRYNAAAKRFEPMQRLPGDGNHAAELFEGPDGAAFLAVANFGDRDARRHRAQSSVWRYSNDVKHFLQIATVQTFGATDWEHFVIDGRHFLAVSEEGEVADDEDQVSRIFELTEGDHPSFPSVKPAPANDDDDDGRSPRHDGRAPRYAEL